VKAEGAEGRWNSGAGSMDLTPLVGKTTANHSLTLANWTLGGGGGGGGGGVGGGFCGWGVCGGGGWGGGGGGGGAILKGERD